METVLIKCPHCGEAMQAPVGRDAILCMFCGGKIGLASAEKPGQPAAADAGTEEREPDWTKHQESLQFVLSHAGAACRDCAAKVKDFNRNTYPALFENHKRENYTFYTSLKSALDSAPPGGLDDFCRQVAAAFVRAQEEALGQVRKKNEKFSMQMDKNMFLVIYVIPAIKGMHGERADRLAETICAEWRKAFKDSNIAVSDYDSIMDGFKRKLCYVTTAVCLNLDKGEDCEELRLIRDFRDGYLSATEEGQALIEEYYDIAPTLVKRIDRDGRAQEKYLRLWNAYLAPCVAYIKSGQPERCKAAYCDMMEELRAEYLVTCSAEPR